MASVTGILGSPRQWAKDLTLATVIGAFLGVIGPFGSYNGGPVELRIAYWVANLWIGLIVFVVVVRLSLRAAAALDLPVWFALAVGTAVGAVPGGFLIATFSAWFWPGNHGQIANWFVWYGQTLAIAEPCAFVYYFLADRRARNDGAGALPTASDAPVPHASVADGGFLGRLPPRLGRDLLCLQMEDHYVRAHTARGSDLVLTPLKDAVAELGDIDGMQVHRSWWVAKAAVVAPVASGRNYALRLSNGLDVPVSRASVAKLRAAGWLSD